MSTSAQRPGRRHPVVSAHLEQRAASRHLRLADVITAFAGSMPFVYVHAAAFAAWMLWFEPNPWPSLTLVVSLEAIFLSTFVLIGQNRQAAFQQAKADHDFEQSELELKANTELTRQIHTLAEEAQGVLIELRDGQAGHASDPAAAKGSGSSPATGTSGPVRASNGRGPLNS